MTDKRSAVNEQRSAKMKKAWHKKTARGEGKMPRMTPAELQARIEAVVEKALQNADGQKAASGDDPIRVIRYPRGRFMGLKARKF